MNRTLSAFLLAGSILTSAGAQEVKYQKYALPNGMTVILHEDHALPVATVNIWYRVGAQDEPPGRSGFAHLFEHLMFMGTRRVPGNQFDILMETGGGANNASTDLHRTNYFSWGPSSLLPTLLWLDADRLEDMGLEMNKEKLDKQRDVVRNELRQTVENAPYGKASEAVFKLLYTPDHPYYNGVIGTHEDLEAASVTNVKDFFANFYVPSNASLVVAGDFDPRTIRPLVDKLFGSLAPGQAITRKYARPTDPIPGRLDRVKRFTAIDKVELPKVEFSYHSPVAFGEGDAEMQLAAEVLAGGKSSRLYKRLVIDEKLASEVSAAQQGFPLGGLFQVATLANPDADLDKVERIMDEELARFLKDGPTADELERHKAPMELRTLAQLQNVERKADRMNEYEYYWGEPDSFKRDLDRFRAATPEAVKSWAARTITPGARVIVRVLPEQPERGPSARDQRPAPADAGSFALPRPETATLPNGLKVLVFPRHDLPLVAMHLLVQPGGYLDQPATKGLASITAEMMGEGAGNLGALAFEDAVQSLGATFNASASRETLEVSMTVLRRNLDRGAGLFADAVLRPRFDASEWDRVQRLRIDEIKQSLEAPPAIAGLVGDRVFFGEDSPAGWPVQGTERTVGGLTLEGVKAAHARLATPGNSTLLIAGDISPADAKALAERLFAGWKGPKSGAVPPQAASPSRAGLEVALVDRPGATQTTIRFIAPGVPYRDATRVNRRLVNTILGGSFTSRLNQNLREDHGYTYGARSGQAMGVYHGSVTAAASVKAENTGAALQEFFKEFDRLAKGDISDAEAAKARETARNEMVRGFAGLSGLLNAASTQIENHLPLETITRDMDAMGLAGAKDLNALARDATPFEKGVLVLVGDKATILAQIKDLNLPPVTEYTPEGEKAAK
jgi:predicted Zn-dependent peptidase